MCHFNRLISVNARKYFLSYDRLKFVSSFTHKHEKINSLLTFQSQASYFSAITFKILFDYTFCGIKFNNLAKKKNTLKKSPTKKKNKKNNRNILFLETN